MSDKKGKITLAGLTKGSSSSSNTFMSSFRFSPESENIEEIIHKPASASFVNAESSSSTPPSPKQNSGDVSPLKEYLLKEKHKWTHKWDKKSLSLDLDLKGKIKTALEDKTKSILSNFIPEESPGVIHTSQSIPENLTRVYSSMLSSPDDNSSSSGSAKGTKNSKMNNSNGSMSNGSQETLDGDCSDIFKAAEGDYQDVEEIGVDMMDPNFEMGADDETIIDKMITFNIPGEDLQEYFDGLPTLYQPISLISGIRITPLDLVGDETEAGQSSNTALRNTVANLQFRHKRASANPSDIRLSTVLINIFSSVVYHPLSKYWAVLVAANFILPFGPFAPFMWFLLGALSILVISKGLSDVPEDEGSEGFESAQQRNTSMALYTPLNIPMYKELKFPIKSQGWMTQLEGGYNPDTCHFKMTKSVFVKLDGPRMYLQYPNSKHRIPKRRLWNDPVLTTSYTFDKIKAYNISNATVSIVPDGLSRNRVWNKKYPIAIKLPKHSISSNYTPPEGTSSDDLQKKDTTTVNYNAGTADVSVNTEKSKSTEKEILRQDCSDEIVYLFARCDREKDDWFRRFVTATKMGTDASYNKRSPPDPLVEYRDFMKRICPSLVPHALQNVSDGFDNVSLPGDTSESRKSTEKNSPSSSKKTTPEREKDLQTSQGASIQSDLENILTIPQSPQFLNAILGRLFYDFLKSAHWRGEVQKLIDKKLFYMKKPAFIEGIHVKELTLGNSIPVILRASPPVLDHQGLWIDFDLNYESNFCVSLETHVNFLKMVTRRGTEGETTPTTSGSSESGNANNGQASTSSPRRSDGASMVSSITPRNSGGGSPSLERVERTSIRSHIYDSEADDSGESSEDEHDSELNNLITINQNADNVDPTAGQSKGAKFLEKIANSSLMSRGLVKKLVDNVAATPLVLAVELQGFFGTLTVNLPGPPNDRIWIGFRTNPDLQLVAKPLKFGDTNINISSITTWIKAKILLEFQRAIVCPNMVDITIPLMEFAIPR